jgi:hypothetical protein
MAALNHRQTDRQTDVYIQNRRGEEEKVLKVSLILKLQIECRNSLMLDQVQK